MISFMYLLSFIFDKAESSFKYSILAPLICYTAPTILTIFITDNWWKWFSCVVFPMQAFNQNIQQMFNPQPEDKTSSLYLKMVIALCQGIIFLILAIYIDDKKCHSFQGMDNQIQTQQRKQLDEREDVLRHKQHTHEIFYNNDM